MRSECLLQRFRPYLAPKSPSRPPEAQIEEELVVLNARPRWTVGSAIGKFTTQNPAVYHPQADKISISLPGPLPVRSSFAGNHSTFALPNIALRVRVLKGCRARPCARAAERARACRRAPGSAMSAVHGVPPWPAQVAGVAAVGQAGQLPRPRRPVSRGLPSRSRVCIDSATAGQSVRGIQAPTGHSARSPATSTSVSSTAPRGPGTLGSQRHAWGRPNHISSSIH